MLTGSWVLTADQALGGLDLVAHFLTSHCHHVKDVGQLSRYFVISFLHSNLGFCNYNYNYKKKLQKKKGISKHKRMRMSNRRESLTVHSNLWDCQRPLGWSHWACFHENHCFAGTMRNSHIRKVLTTRKLTRQQHSSQSHQWPMTLLTFGLPLWIDSLMGLKKVAYIMLPWRCL